MPCRLYYIFLCKIQFKDFLLLKLLTLYFVYNVLCIFKGDSGELCTHFVNEVRYKKFKSKIGSMGKSYCQQTLLLLITLPFQTVCCTISSVVEMSCLVSMLGILSLRLNIGSIFWIFHDICSPTQTHESTCHPCSQQGLK